jgi:hypothetical protein
MSDAKQGPAAGASTGMKAQLGASGGVPKLPAEQAEEGLHDDACRPVREWQSPPYSIGWVLHTVTVDDLVVRTEG